MRPRDCQRFLETSEKYGETGKLSAVSLLRKIQEKGNCRSLPFLINTNISQTFMKFPNKYYIMILHALFNVFIIYIFPQKVDWFSLRSDEYDLSEIEVSSFTMLSRFLRSGLVTNTRASKQTQIARF